MHALYEGCFFWSALLFLCFHHPCMKPLRSCVHYTASKCEALTNWSGSDTGSFSFAGCLFGDVAFTWFGFSLDPVSLASVNLENAMIGFLSARGWALPFISWNFMDFSRAVPRSLSFDCRFSIITGFGELISYLVQCT